MTWVIVLVVLVYLSLGAAARQPTVTENPQSRLAIELLLTFPGAYGALAGLIVSLGGLLAVAYGAAVAGGNTVSVVRARRAAPPGWCAATRPSSSRTARAPPRSG